MIHLYDRATMASASTLAIPPRIQTLLAARINALVTADYDVTDDTEYLIVEPGDTEADIIGLVGFSPLVDPIDGARFGDAAFQPFWDLLADRGGVFEMIITYGSAFAYVLLIQDAPNVIPELLTMCHHYQRGGGEGDSLPKA